MTTRPHTWIAATFVLCAGLLLATAPLAGAGQEGVAQSDDALIRSVYKAMSAETEDGLRFELSDFRTYLPAEFDRVALEAAISPPEAKEEKAAAADDGSAGTFSIPGEARDLEGPWARPEATLADLAAWYKELFPSMGAGLRAVTSYQVTARRGDSERQEYRAAFVWLASGPSQDAADQQFVLADHRATEMVESMEVELKKAPDFGVADDGGIEGIFAAAETVACHHRRDRVPYKFPSESGTQGHGSGSLVYHRASAKVNLICICDENCNARSKVKWKKSFCGDWNNLFDIRYTGKDDDGFYHVPQPEGGQRGTVEAIVDQSLNDSTRVAGGAAFLCTLKRCEDRNCAVSSSVGGAFEVGQGITFSFQRDTSPAMIWSNSDQKISRTCAPCDLDKVGVCEPDKGEDCFDPDCACRAPLKCSPTLRRCVQSCGDGVVDPGENCLTCPADFPCIGSRCNPATGACEQCPDPCANDGRGTKCAFWSDQTCGLNQYCGNCEGLPNATCDLASKRCNTNRICISNCVDLSGRDACNTFRNNSCGVLEFCECHNPGEVCSGNVCVRGLAGQDDEGDCQLTFSPDVAQVAAAGANDMAIDVSASCGWLAAASASWIHLTAGSVGTGQGSIFYQVEPNPEDVPRQAAILINDQSVEVIQDGSVCAPVLAPSGATVSAAGAENTVQVAAGCAWTAVSDSPWVQITSGQSTVGTGSFTYRVWAYQGTVNRTAKIRVGATDFLVVQQADPNGAGCQASINPPAGQVGSSGALGYVVNVETSSSGCRWLAQSHVPWIRVISGSEGRGNGQVQLDVAANPASSPRFGVLTIAGLSYQVTQDGVPCTAEISPLLLTVPSAGATGVGLNVSSACDWQTGLIPWWITVRERVQGEDGYLLLDVAQNIAGAPRSGSFLVAGQSVRVDQSACTGTNSLQPASLAVGPAASTGLFTKLIMPGGCAWTAASNVPWLSLTSAASGAGNATVTFNVAALSGGGSRTGTLRIADQTFTVTQDNLCSFSISPASASYGNGGGTGSVAVTGKPGCNWSAFSGAPWITITQVISGANGTVRFNVAANTATATRTGTLTIAGKAFTVTQSGAVPTTPPAAPGPLVATASQSGPWIEVSWTDNSLDEAGFRLEKRRADGANWTEIAQTGPDEAGATDVDVTPGVTYVYRVRACNAIGCSAYSMEATGRR